MPLVKATLQASLKSRLKSALNINKDETDPVIAVNNMADQLSVILADEIDKYIKSGIVNTTVVTAGTATAQTGTGIGSIT